MLPLVIPSIILGIALLTLVIKVLGIEPSLLHHRRGARSSSACPSPCS